MMIPVIAALTMLALQEPPGGGGPPRPGPVEPAKGDRIAWFGTWEAGLAEAKRTNRPILLVSAAPHCHGVPGIW